MRTEWKEVGRKAAEADWAGKQQKQTKWLRPTGRDSRGTGRKMLGGKAEESDWAGLSSATAWAGYLRFKSIFLL